MTKHTRQPALLLQVDVGRYSLNTAGLDEFSRLAEAAGAAVRGVVRLGRHKPDTRYFVGRGQAEDLHQRLLGEETELLIVNQNLSPSQERNLERLCQARVLGRSGLILDIFTQRARSYEGKLQVELAQLEYLSTRLVRGWSHLERQKGGIGLRGPGEKQIETDRRLIKKRILLINKRLNKIKHQRNLGRRLREKNQVPTIALIGYTNAGKSSLFNRLVRSDAYVADHPFATLDTLMRRIRLGEAGNAILSDTVGFIRDLPHTLIEAFNATLLEICKSNLLVNVVDASHQECDEHNIQVEEILRTLGAHNIPQLIVFNKADLVSHRPYIRYNSKGLPSAVSVSAQTGSGIDLLKQALEEHICVLNQSRNVVLPVDKIHA